MKRLFLLCAMFVVLGCSPVRVEQIEVKASNDPLHEPRQILERYASGQALGSEVTSFPKLVDDVRKVDATRADVLDKGLNDLQKASPAARPALAKTLLAKLQPSMK
jgi:hypothetical protein